MNKTFCFLTLYVTALTRVWRPNFQLMGEQEVFSSRFSFSHGTMYFTCIKKKNSGILPYFGQPLRPSFEIMHAKDTAHQIPRTRVYTHGYTCTSDFNFNAEWYESRYSKQNDKTRDFSTRSTQTQSCKKKKKKIQNLKSLRLKQDCEDYQTRANKPRHNWNSGSTVGHSWLP